MEHSDGSLTDVLAWRRGVSVIELMAYKQTARSVRLRGRGGPKGLPDFGYNQLSSWEIGGRDLESLNDPLSTGQP